MSISIVPVLPTDNQVPAIWLLTWRKCIISQIVTTFRSFNFEYKISRKRKVYVYRTLGSSNKVTISPKKNYWQYTTETKPWHKVEWKNNKQAWLNSIYQDKIKNMVKNMNLVATCCEWRNHGPGKYRRQARMLELLYILTWLAVTWL